MKNFYSKYMILKIISIHVRRRYSSENKFYLEDYYFNGDDNNKNNKENINTNYNFPSSSFENTLNLTVRLDELTNIYKNMNKKNTNKKNTNKKNTNKKNTNKKNTNKKKYAYKKMYKKLFNTYMDDYVEENIYNSYADIIKNTKKKKNKNTNKKNKNNNNIFKGNNIFLDVDKYNAYINSRRNTAENYFNKIRKKIKFIIDKDVHYRTYYKYNDMLFLHEYVYDQYLFFFRTFSKSKQQALLDKVLPISINKIKKYSFFEYKKVIQIELLDDLGKPESYYPIYLNLGKQDEITTGLIKYDFDFYVSDMLDTINQTYIDYLIGNKIMSTPEDKWFIFYELKNELKKLMSQDSNEYSTCKISTFKKIRSIINEYDYTISDDSINFSFTVMYKKYVDFLKNWPLVIQDDIFTYHCGVLDIKSNELLVNNFIEYKEKLLYELLDDLGISLSDYQSLDKNEKIKGLTKCEIDSYVDSLMNIIINYNDGYKEMLVYLDGYFAAQWDMYLCSPSSLDYCFRLKEKLKTVLRNHYISAYNVYKIVKVPNIINLINKKNSDIISNNWSVKYINWKTIYSKFFNLVNKNVIKELLYLAWEKSISDLKELTKEQLFEKYLVEFLDDINLERVEYENICKNPSSEFRGLNCKDIKEYVDILVKNSRHDYKKYLEWEKSKKVDILVIYPKFDSDYLDKLLKINKNQKWNNPLRYDKFFCFLQLKEEIKKYSLKMKK